MGQGIIRNRRVAMQALYLVVESIAWFAALRVIVTGGERVELREIAGQLDDTAVASLIGDPRRAFALATELRQAAPDVVVGPSLLVVVLAAAGGYLLMRQVRQLDLGAGLGAVVLVAGTVLGVNVLLALVSGNVRFWDPSGVIAFVAGPDARFETTRDVQSFIDDPGIGRPHGAALTYSLVGLTAVWVRFLVGSRGDLNLERMARSFSLAFLALLIALVFAKGADVPVSSFYGVLLFVLGVLGLAIANHERALPAEGAARRASAWATSVGVTVLVLAGAGAIVGVLGYLQVGAVLDGIGSAIVTVVFFVLVILITPVYWVIQFLASRFLPASPLDRLAEGLQDLTLQEALQTAEDTGNGSVIPEWASSSLKFLAVIAAVYVAYRIARRLMRPRGRGTEAVAEVRSTSSGGARLGELLAGIVPLPRRDRSEDWRRRHGIYALFGRTLDDGAERGLTRLPAETPGEYASAAERLLDARPFGPIARLFERARYGRRYPSREEMGALHAELQAWERATPPSEETRARIQGGRGGISDYDEIRLRVAKVRRMARTGEYEDPRLY